MQHLDDFLRVNATQEQRDTIEREVADFRSHFPSNEVTVNVRHSSHPDGGEGLLSLNIRADTEQVSFFAALVKADGRFVGDDETPDPEDLA